MTDKRKFNGGAKGRRWAVNGTQIAGYVPQSWVDELVRFHKTQSEAVRVALDIALHPLEHGSKIIALAEPLPCGIRKEGGTCGKSSYVAHANLWRNPVLPGHWVLLPVCKECALAVAKIYEDK